MTVTTPQGFRASASSAGLKTSGPDMMLLVNDGPQPSHAMVATTNRVQAAPVQWMAGQIASQSPLRAVLVNSGNANACTGAQGIKACNQIATALAGHLDTDVQTIGLSSTGMIGVQLPVAKMTGQLPTLVADLAGDGKNDDAVAHAILTTDTRTKTALVRAAEDEYSIAVIAKGAGMLAPGMATMLCYITTDAEISSVQLGKALRNAVAETLNCLDSDGCMSTNDTVLAMASGASGIQAQTGAFTELLTGALRDITMQLLADAEGAEHDITIEVSGAHSAEAARIAGRAIARSNLFKTAIFGQDPNWGRIVASLGTVSETDCPFDPDSVDVSINGHLLARGGSVIDPDPRHLVDMSARDVLVSVNLNYGPHTGTIWTNDLTLDYVRENSEYST